MRIGIFTDTFTPQINGVVTSINILKKELINKGHEVFVFAPRIPGYFDITPNIFRFPSLPFIFLPEHRLSWSSAALMKNFEKLGLEIIHSQTPFFVGWLAARLSKKYRIPHIHTYHTFFEKYGHYILMPEKLNRFVTKYVSHRFCNQAQLVIAPSRDMLGILKTYGFKTPLVEISTGIDLEDFPRQPDPVVMRKLGLAEGRQYLVYAGRLAEEKNLDFLLAAFARIAPEFPQVDFLIIGSGPKKGHLQHLAEKRGLSGRIIFTGYLQREEVLQCFKFCRLFVFASLTETQGMVILEAMTAGLPVVALKAMGIGEIMGDNRGGFLTKNNLEDFCEKIRLLLLNDGCWRAKSTEAQKVAARFSASWLVDRVIECYRKYQVV